MKPNKKILKIHPLDNLIVALSDLNKGEIFNIGNKKIKLKPVFYATIDYSDMAKKVA